LAFLPSFESSLINVVTISGVIIGLIESQKRKISFRLSTLFFLTPLVYGSTKPFRTFINKLKVRDNG